MDVRMFTVGPVQENCFIVAPDGSDRGADRRPGRGGAEAARGDRGARASTIEAILLTHTHFDHVGAVAPVARATGAPVYCPELEVPVLADIMALRALARLRPVRELRRRRDGQGGERLELAGPRRSTCSSRPATAPGHVTYSIPDRAALFSGDVLFQGSVGRTDLPGGDWPTLPRSIATLLDTLPGRDAGLPGPHGPHHARARARDEPVPARARAAVSRIQAPRGTFDVLPEQAAARARASSARRARILEAAGYGRIETPAFEATELFARGVGESTDVVQKEMYTFDDGGGRSLTLRPEGTAPVCRAYVEHGMHKLPSPVRLWYLSSFFRHEAPQAGRYRQFWQVGAEAIGSDDPAVDAESIVLLAELLEALGVRDAAAAALEPRLARRRARPTATSCRPTCARTRTPLAEVRERHRAEPAARLRLRRPGHPRGDGRRAAAARPPRRATTPSTSPRCARCSTRPGCPTRSTRRSCAAWTTTRARCSSSRPTRSAPRAASAAAGATTGWSSSSAARRRPAPAGRPGSSGCCWPRRARAAARRRPRSTCSSPTTTERRARAFGLARGRRGALACARSWSWPAARSRASSSRPTASAPATSRSSARTATALKDMESGEQRDVDRDAIVPTRPGRGPL